MRIDYSSIGVGTQTRCHLQPLSSEDHTYLVGLFTNPMARAYLGGPVDIDTARSRSTSWIEESSRSPIWSIRRKLDSRFLGYALLSPHHDGLETEISYALLPQHWGHGYACEALSMALGLAFKDFGLGKVIAETQAKNLRSTRLLERVGMLPEQRIFRFGEEQIIYGIHASPLPSSPETENNEYSPFPSDAQQQIASAQ